MRYEDLPLDVRLTDRFLERMEWVRAEDRTAVQNYYDGRVKLVPADRAQHMTRPIEKQHMGAKVLVPPGWRVVSGEEAARLWRVQVYKDFYEREGAWGQHEYETSATRLATSGSRLPENLSALPPDVRRQFRALEREQVNLERGRARMEKYGGRDVRRGRDGKWHIGGYLGGKAKALAAWLRHTAEEARVERDAEFEQQKNSELYRQEALREKARHRARVEAGLEAGTPAPASEKPVRARRKKAKAAIHA